MGFLRKLRLYLGKRYLNKELQRTNRVRKPVNLTNATSIGIVYQLNSEEEYNRVSLFTKKLQDQGKKVHVIGLYHYNRIPVFYIPKLSYDLLLPRNIDILFRPSEPFVTEFIQTEFDMLIDLSNPDVFTLHYIASLSKAKFKLGRRIDDRPLPYDLMIDTGSDISSEQLLEQIVHYTSTLNFKISNEPDSIQPDQLSNHE